MDPKIFKDYPPLSPARPRANNAGLTTMLVVVALVAGGAWWLWPRPPARQPAAAVKPVAAPKKTAVPLTPARQQPQGLAPPVATVVRPSKAPTAAKPSPPSARAEPTIPPAAGVKAAAARPASPGITIAAPVARPTYSADDPDVTPPTAISAQMLIMLERSSPGNRPEVMTISVVVNEKGTVDSVKAVNVPISIGESVMLTAALSAVKAWHFRPAMKDGTPVRFRHIVPVKILSSTP